MYKERYRNYQDVASRKERQEAPEENEAEKAEYFRDLERDKEKLQEEKEKTKWDR